MPYHYTLRRQPKKTFVASRASSNPVLWSETWNNNDMQSPRYNNGNIYWATSEKSRMSDFGESLVNKQMTYETVTKKKQAQPVQQHSSKGSHIQSQHHHQSQEKGDSHSNGKHSRDSSKPHHQQQQPHSKHIQRVRKATPKNLQMVAPKPDEEQQSPRNQAKKAAAVDTMSQSSADAEVKYIGAVTIKKDKHTYADSLIRSFDVSVWQCCEIVETVGSPSARNLKFQTLATTLSCWNYLFSTQGKGFGRPVTYRVLEKILMDNDVYDFTVNNSTVNDILVQWIFTLNNKFGTTGNAFMFYKPVGRNSTTLSGGEALTILQSELNHKNTLFVYHAHDALLIPVGYQTTNGSLKGRNAEVTVIVFADPATGKLISIPWVDVMLDLECQLPYYFDVKSKSQGLLVNPSKNSTGNSHCIIAFQDDTSSQFKINVENETKATKTT